MSVCIYCYGNGPFNQEHVFPYSLGGGGQGWTLNNLVCEDCNNSFSSLERELARHSIESLSRLVYGPEGRSRKKTKRLLPLYADGIFYLPETSDLVYEGGLDLGVTPYLRAQIIEVGSVGSVDSSGSPVYRIVGSDRGEVLELLNRIRKFSQGENFFLITKIPTKKGEHFEVADLNLDDRKVCIDQIRSIPKVKTKYGAWYEVFPSSIDDRRFTPRIYLDDEQRLVLRATDIKNAVHFLSPIIHSIHHGSSALDDQVNTATVQSTGAGPRYIVNMTMQPILSARAVAKIACNFLACLYGEDFAKRPTFDEIKAFIRGDQDNTLDGMEKHVRRIGDNISTFDMIRTRSDCHWLFITHNKKDGNLIFGIRFYGVGGYIVKLGNLRKIPFRFTSTPNIDFLSVNYSERITRLIPTSEIVTEFVLNRASARFSQK